VASVSVDDVRDVINVSLLVNGYVERVSLGVYKVTPKGKKLLEILN
jgi:predicted transcriptional regulator